MLRCLTLLVAALGLGGCAFTASHPLVLAPTPADWQRAYQLVDADTQRALDRGTGTPVAAATATAAIYRLGEGLPARPLDSERLDLATTTSGYGRAFNADPGQRWIATTTQVFSQTRSSGGRRRELFELDWIFRAADGTTWAAQGIATSPGVRTEQDYSESDLVRDANVGFATAFLRMIASAKRLHGDPP